MNSGMEIERNVFAGRNFRLELGALLYSFAVTAILMLANKPIRDL